MAGELFAKSKSKVVPFDQNGQFYYRKARKYMESNNYIDALSFYRKAVEKDPDNVEYRLDLADIFTEMGYYEESNQILFSILQEDDQRGDCYFGLGCNFLGLQEYEKAGECFDKYLQTQPEGIYSEDAQDLLDILQNHDFYFDDDMDILNPAKERLYRMANKGKDFLDTGDYKKAIRYLESVIKKEPSLVFARNNLALAYFCTGQLDKAIDMCQSVLYEYPQNVHANCNIAIFLHEKKDMDKSEEHLQTILGLQIEDPEEIHKIAVTLCELRRHKEANRHLRLLLQYKPYDIRILHYIAVSYFNIGRYKEALQYWNKIDKISPHNTISSFYRRLAQNTLRNEREYRELAYHFQVPYEEVVYRIKKINDLLKLPERDLKQRWAKGDELMALLGWGLRLNDVSIKKAILNVIASFKDQKAERYLRDFILKKNVGDQLKREALALLKQMGAAEPYIAYMNNNVVEIKVDIMDMKCIDVPSILDSIADVAIYGMKDRYEEGYETEIQEIWESFIAALYPDRLPRIRKQEAWAAALELYYCETMGIPANKMTIAQHYGVAYSTVLNNCKRINTVLRTRGYY
jgi:tetratricopeptide (TPR) repeat protein